MSKQNKHTKFKKNMKDIKTKLFSNKTSDVEHIIKISKAIIYLLIYIIFKTLEYYRPHDYIC